MKLVRFIKDNLYIENIILLVGLLISLIIFINSFAKYFKEKKNEVSHFNLKKEMLAKEDNVQIIKQGQVLYNTPL